MGVSGSGKSTIGAALAHRLGLSFTDADALHPAENVAKMAAGIPLTDDDRWPWLARVGDALHEAGDSGHVIACSALRRAYRDAIRAKAPDVEFVHLQGSSELLAARLGVRANHFMPATLLESQLATLEPFSDDETGVIVDIDATPEAIVDRIIDAIDG